MQVGCCPSITLNILFSQTPPSLQLRPLGSCVTFVSGTVSPCSPYHMRTQLAVALATAQGATSSLALGFAGEYSPFHSARDGKGGL